MRATCPLVCGETDLKYDDIYGLQRGVESKLRSWAGCVNTADDPTAREISSDLPHDDFSFSNSHENPKSRD